MTEKFNFDKALDEVLKEWFLNGYKQGYKDGYKEFNSEQPEVKQEPVAYLCENAVGHKYFRWKKPSSVYKPIPLYTKEIGND
jgi:hypothetical protein